MVSIGPKYVKKIPGFYIISILVQNYEKSDEKKIKQKQSKLREDWKEKQPQTIAREKQTLAREKQTLAREIRLKLEKLDIFINFTFLIKIFLSLRMFSWQHSWQTK